MIIIKTINPGRYGQWIIAVGVGFCSFTMGQMLGWPAVAFPKVIDGSAGFPLSDLEKSLTSAFGFIGNTLSPIPAAYLMDKIGKKNAVLVFNMATILSWLLLYFSSTGWLICLARTLLGIGTAGQFAIIPLFIGEVFDKSIRGLVAGFYSNMVVVGALYEGILGFLNYGMLNICSMIPSIVLMCIFLIIPESPHFYISRNNDKKAIECITWARGDCDSETFQAMVDGLRQQLGNRGQFTDIFKTKASIIAFISVETIHVMQRFSGLVLLSSYVTTVVPDSFVKAKDSFTVLCVIWIVFSIGCSFIAHKIRRKTLLVTSCSLCSITMAVVTVWFYLRDSSNVDTSTTEYVPMVFLILNSASYAVGILPVPFMVQGEMFSAELKSKCSALIVISASLASAACVYLFYPLKSAFGVGANFVIPTVAPLVGILLAATIMVETKGKTLESIQNILNSK